MKPYYEHAGITIYHGDCREILPGLDGPAALVSDPPYGIGWGRSSWPDDPKTYPEMIRWLVAEGNRLEGWCFVFQSMVNVGRFHEWFPDGWRIFAACKNFAQIRPTAVWYSWDPVVFWNSGPNSGPNSGIPNRDFHVGNVAGVFREKAEHPCPRPVDTMRHIVQLASPIGGLCIDPFCGVGTTLLACLQTRRRAIGIEIEEKYCEIAVQRLAQEVLPIETHDWQDENRESDGLFK